MTTGELKPKIFRESAIRNNGSGKIYFFKKSFQTEGQPIRGSTDPNRSVPESVLKKREI